MVGAPEIYGKRVDKTALPEVSKNLKEKTKELKNYQSILQDLEKNVILKQVELEKQKLRNIAYATNTNRGAKADYNKLALSIKDKSGYTAPKNLEDKALYDVAFRLKELGFAKDINLTQKIEYTDKLAREIIAFQKLAKLKGQEGVVGPETLKALMRNEVTASTVLDNASGLASSENDTLEKNKEEPSERDISSQENSDPLLIESNDTEKKDGMDIPAKIIKKFEVATALTNTLDNMNDKEEKTFRKLDKKLNKDDILYNEFENSVVQKIEKTYKEKGTQMASEDIKQNVSELIKNYSEGYLKNNTEAEKEIELDPNVFFAIRDTIVEFLFNPDVNNEKKEWVILFVRSFTNNFNDILQACEREFEKSALTMITSNRLSTK